MKLMLTLPVPTSINKLYINEYNWQFNPATRKKEKMPTGRRILSTDGRKVKARIQAEARMQLKEQLDHWDYEWTKDNYVYQDAFIVFARRGSDDNNIYKLMNDSLEGIIYDNDSRVLVRTQQIVYDSKNPRVELTIAPVDYKGIFRGIDEYEDFVNRCELGGGKGCSRFRNGSCSVLKDSISGTIRPEVGDVHQPFCTSFSAKK